MKIKRTLRPTKCIRFLVSARVASDPRVSIFNLFFAMKQCPIAAKIIGLIEILSRCVLNDFSYIGV